MIAGGPPLPETVAIAVASAAPLGGGAMYSGSRTSGAVLIFSLREWGAFGPRPPGFMGQALSGKCHVPTLVVSVASKGTSLSITIGPGWVALGQSEAAEKYDRSTTPRLRSLTAVMIAGRWTVIPDGRVIT